MYGYGNGYGSILTSHQMKTASQTQTEQLALFAVLGKEVASCKELN